MGLSANNKSTWYGKNRVIEYGAQFKLLSYIILSNRVGVEVTLNLTT
jgi:hypothetical protein